MSDSLPSTPAQEALSAASFISQHLLTVHRSLWGGASRSPASVAQCLALCAAVGLVTVGITETPTFSACTVLVVDVGWRCFFNRAATQCQQQRYLIHEAAEYLLATIEDCPIQNAPCMEGVNLGAWRHDVACCVVNQVLE